MKHRASLTFDKVIVDGKPVFRLMSCEGILQEDELPESYTAKEPYFWHMKDDEGIETPDEYFTCGDNLTPDEYKDITEYLTECGKRLTEILITEARIRKTHNGTIVFKV